MNTWIGIGRLASDPELRYTPQGTAVAHMRLAVPRPTSGDDADFFDVVVWDKQAEACAEHLHKGRRVAVDGSLRQQTWTDEESQQRRSRVEIVAGRVEFLDAPRRADQPAEHEQEQEPAPAA